MPYYILHSYMGAHHYAIVDVLSDSPVEWMFYYILHRYTGAHQYVCVDVLWDCSYYWMPYYKLHIKMDAHPYVYHRNICIHHSVHKVVHSEYPGKKK